jgi:hypothetical protein
LIASGGTVIKGIARPAIGKDGNRKIGGEGDDGIVSGGKL